MSNRTTTSTPLLSTTTILSTTSAATNQTLTNVNCPSIGSTLIYGVVNATGFFMNLILIVLIVKHTTPALRPYAEVLITSCAIDVYSSFFQFLTQARPTFEGPNRIMTFSMDGMLPWWVQNWSMFEGGKLNYILVPEYIGVPFLYRYLMICWDHQMRRWEFASLTFILFSLALFCSITINYAAAGVYDLNVVRVPKANPNCTRFLPQFSAGMNMAEKPYNQIFELWSNGTMVILATYLITLFCLVRIQVFFCMQVGSDPVQNKIQRQISWTLSLQAITPLVAFYGPQAMFQLLSLFKIYWMYAFELLFVSYAAIPVLNSLTVYVLIASYREAFFTLASNVGHQILTTVRLSRYVSGGTSVSSTRPLFENAKGGGEKVKTVPKDKDFMVVQDF